MDWLLTVPVLLRVEIGRVMKLSSGEASQKCSSLGVSSALKIIVGYPGGPIVEGNLVQRLGYEMLAWIPFCHIGYEPPGGPGRCHRLEVRSAGTQWVFRALWVTVVSWLTCPRRLPLPHARRRRGSGGGEHPGGYRYWIACCRCRCC